MDFWDLTKLLVRRWYFALPMLLLSALLTVLTFGWVKPDYVATAYVQLVAPVQRATKPGEASPEQRNPWLGQGLQSLGNAAIIKVLDRTVENQMKASGLSDSYTVEMGGNTPAISFEIVGSSERQARETAERLVEVFNRSVAELQSEDGVTNVDAIRTRRLDQGTNVEESDSKVKRALVAVAGAGLMLTAAVTIGLDAWLRRRLRRRPAAPPAAPAPPVSEPVTEAADEATVGTRPKGSDPGEIDMPTVVLSRSNRTASGAGTEGSSAAESPAAPSSAAPSSAAPSRTDDMPSDATIVLPLSLAAKESWSGRSGKTQRP